MTGCKPREIDKGVGLPYGLAGPGHLPSEIAVLRLPT
jgi:hypothetical protein